MAQKKGGGSTRNGRDSNPKYLGVKLYGGQAVEAGNILGKAFSWLAGKPVAHVIVGARAPVLIPSRVERADDKLLSIALGVLSAEG